MPDIAKINAVAIADIEKVDGILAANIEKVNGLTFATGIPAPVAAYSVRLLDTAVGVPTYTGACMRVRRASDNVEADIAFDAGELKLTSGVSNTSDAQSYTDFGDFVDHTGTPTDGFVRWLYDQSGNANDAGQSTSGLQPKIYDSSTGIVTDGAKPAMSVASGDRFTANGFASSFDGEDIPLSFFCVANPTNQNQFQYLWDIRGLNASYQHSWLRGGGLIQVRKIDNVGTSSGVTRTGSWSTGQNLFSIVSNGTSQDVYINNTSQVSAANVDVGVSTFTDVSILTDLVSSNTFIGFFQELVVYNVNQTDNRTDIETNINSDYLIYQPTDAPTSGLLYDYGSATGGTDAAAAYSVRQLANTAVISMRVRRDSDDEERNFGFDTNGDLDTAGIASFCGTANGYVTRWWDQSTNGNHADQATDTSQPQIYNGTAVITKNGNPSLSFDGSGDNLEYTGNFLGGSAATGVSVSSFDNATRTAREIMWGAQDSAGGRYDFLITRQASNVGSGTTQNGIDLYVEGNFAPLNNPNVGTITDTDQHLFTAIYSDTVRRIVYNNGSSLTTSSSTALGNLTDATSFVIGADISGGINSIDGQVQEIVIWNADQEADGNRTGIETNIDTYYQIP